MTAKELFQAGQLGEAITALNNEVKADPNNPELRTFLFELLCFTGNWDRAEKQLDVVAQQDPQNEWAVQVYRNVLEAERSREALFSQGRKPEFLLDPPDYVQHHLEAVNRIREGNHREAKELLDRSQEERPTLRVTVNGRDVEGFCDCDDLLAPVLELIVMRDYIWLPLDQVREVELPAPERPRDLVWLPIRLLLRDDSQRSGYTPTRYVGSATHENEQIQLARMTDWLEEGDGPVRGMGQRLFLAGDDALPVLEARSLQIQGD